MKILLLGDYSNVHCTLGAGLRQLGHEVTVASDGDGWKNYPRDIDLKRQSTGLWDTLKFMAKIERLFPQFKGYDVVQIINPVFLQLKGERMWRYYQQIRKQNGAVFMGAFGMDHYYVKACLDCKTFKYSDFNMGNTIRESEENSIWIQDWLHGAKGELNRKVAEDCNGIIAGLYEYYASYCPYFQDKLTYIPFPIVLQHHALRSFEGHDKVRFFIGIQRKRSVYKGTDIMLRALERVVAEYPDACEMFKVESVPFQEYQRLLRGSDVILDQLYSYTPAMNALEAMAQGLIVVGGAEPENYEILHEDTLRPIINVEPNEASVYQALKDLVCRRKEVPRLAAESRSYIEKHHDHVKVAQRYLDFWKSRM